MKRVMAKGAPLFLSGSILAATLLVAGPQAVLSSAQAIPVDRRISWKPGIPGGIPEMPVTANVKDFGAKGDGSSDDSSAFQRALDSMPSRGTLLVPEGTYLIESTLRIRKSVVIRGESPLLTRLLVSPNAGPAILIRGAGGGAYMPILDGYAKGSTTLKVADPSAFTPGMLGEIQQDNDPVRMYTKPTWIVPWAVDAVGQIVKIVAVSGDTITIDEPLRLGYDARFKPRIRPLTVLECAGVERLKLVRLGRNYGRQGPTAASMIVLAYVAYGWVREVESENAPGIHVYVASGYQCEIRDSYFHGYLTEGYVDGPIGYGVHLQYRTSNCLVEDNIFRRLRHAMMVSIGATGNVFGYNYSREVLPHYPEERDPPADISLHGHFSNFNLFEGNIVEEIRAADYWGPAGPGNTFFRNRIEARGIQIRDFSHQQDVVGNEVPRGTLEIEPSVRDLFSHGNLLQGRLTWDPGVASRELPPSLYLVSRPGFYGAQAWPSVGADRPNGTNPAKAKYATGIIFSH